MTKIATTVAAAALTLTLSMAPALADPHCAAQRWAGLYGGINVGAAQHMVDAKDFGPNIIFNTGEQSNFTAGKGSTAGAQLGYNFVRCNTVFGVEADYNNSKVQSHFVDTRPQTNPVTRSTSFGSFGTLRARSGFAFDQSLIYLTGGWAFGTTKHSQVYAPLGNPEFSWSESGRRTGWTVGAGIEHALSDRFSFKGEVLYLDLGEQAYLGSMTPPLLAALV
jgi:outer membrane immunogenic protein